MRKLLFFSLLFFIISNSYSQSYKKVHFRPPLNGKLKVSGNFCEFRTNHFHAGLDLRTKGKNQPVYAIANGYISRIKISPFGYGNALYITHKNGYISVYAHLNYFEPKIQKWIRHRQIKLQRFHVDIQIDSNMFPVKKGEIIAYSGNSGRSFGPHLHFEIRNLKEEPLNPQLFHFNILDTKAPKITKIAVYPADNKSYVNGHNYSRAFAIKHGKINSQITVHGNIYFGIEAFDYLDNTTSTNAIYSTKLFVDGKLIYFSEFDKFSYENNRDINSMIDYRRRKIKGWKIQRCFVDPNNELYHYKVDKDKGIVKFQDDKRHKIKFIVSDIYNNKKSLQFYIQSTSKQKYFIQKKYTKILKYDTINTFRSKGIRIFFPEKSLFNNVPFYFFRSKGNKYSPIYHAGNEFYPLKKAIILSLSIFNVPKKLKTKAVVCNLDFNGRKKYLTGKIKNNYLTVKTFNLGKYYIDVDTVAPKITPYNISQGKNMSRYRSIKIKISDNMSGIKSWKTFVNGSWVLSSYDAKNKMISYYFDKKTHAGKNNFHILVSDKSNNYSSYKIFFYR